MRQDDGTADLPNYFRKPYGPGWALVGDASLVKDPITGQGIGDAFRDAELLVEAIEAGYSGKRPLDEALAGYQQKRDEFERPMYQFTTQLVAFAPPRIEEQVLFAALQRNDRRSSKSLVVPSFQMRNVLPSAGFSAVVSPRSTPS